MTDPMARALTLINDLEVAIRQITKPGPVAKPNNRPKLTKNDVKRVFIMRRNGASIADIAECFDCNKSTISRTLRGVYH